MKFVVEKNHLGGQIWYRSLVPPIKKVPLVNTNCFSKIKLFSKIKIIMKNQYESFKFIIYFLDHHEAHVIS